MKHATQPYLHFNEQCKEAMQFYQSVFGGELDLLIIGESDMKEHFPAEVQHQVLNASLVNGAFKMMGSDMCGMGTAEFGNAVQIVVDCSSEIEIRRIYAQLSEGGKIHDELKVQFWGALFAMVQDKFGHRWMLSFDLN